MVKSRFFYGKYKAKSLSRGGPWIRHCLCGNLFDAKETHIKHVIKTSYTIKWEFHVTLVLRNCLFWFENWLSTLYFIRMEPWNTSKYVTWLLSSALINALLYYSTRSEVDLTRPLGWKRRTEMSTSFDMLHLASACFGLLSLNGNSHWDCSVHLDDVEEQCYFYGNKQRRSHH